jgi:hypothetical protein
MKNSESFEFDSHFSLSLSADLNQSSKEISEDLSCEFFGKACDDGNRCKLENCERTF